MPLLSWLMKSHQAESHKFLPHLARHRILPSQAPALGIYRAVKRRPGFITHTQSSREAPKPVHPVGQHAHSFKGSPAAQIASIQKKFKVCHLQSSSRLGGIPGVGTGSSRTLELLGQERCTHSSGRASPPARHIHAKLQAQKGKEMQLISCVLQKPTHIINGNTRQNGEGSGLRYFQGQSLIPKLLRKELHQPSVIYEHKILANPNNLSLL